MKVGVVVTFFAVIPGRRRTANAKCAEYAKFAQSLLCVNLAYFADSAFAAHIQLRMTAKDKSYAVNQRSALARNLCCSTG